jgi:hypothetical protein
LAQNTVIRPKTVKNIGLKRGDQKYQNRRQFEQVPMIVLEL